jgi:hypothetical protein
MPSTVSRFKSLVDQLDGVGAEVKEHDKTMNSLLNNLLETWEINVKAWIEQSLPLSIMIAKMRHEENNMKGSETTTLALDVNSTMKKSKFKSKCFFSIVSWPHGQGL